MDVSVKSSKTYTFTMNEDEASILAALVGSVRDYDASRNLRGFLDTIWEVVAGLDGENRYNIEDQIHIIERETEED